MKREREKERARYTVHSKSSNTGIHQKIIKIEVQREGPGTKTLFMIKQHKRTGNSYQKSALVRNSHQPTVTKSITFVTRTPYDEQ